MSILPSFLLLTDDFYSCCLDDWIRNDYTAGRRIAKTLPGVKLVVLLREPVARAYSEWQVSVHPPTRQPINR